MEKTKIVLDTSLFVNPEIRKDFGSTPTEALEAFLFLAAQLPVFEFYMPPSIFKELMHFVQKDRLAGDLLYFLKQKPPSRYQMTVPATFLYELVEEMRDRINKGLRVAEAAVRSVEQKGEPETIKDLRRKYREALREGIIDSRQDVDLILLAKELDATLVTADQGVIDWAEKLGIKWLYPDMFREFLMSAIKRASETKEAFDDRTTSHNPA
ncbi:MAG: RNA ligase partner protein [Nitrospirae bacterium]|nr:MAG: RNA ligase partner protein [Nitrospirota bacterium]